MGCLMRVFRQIQKNRLVSTGVAARGLSGLAFMCIALAFSSLQGCGTTCGSTLDEVGECLDQSAMSSFVYGDMVISDDSVNAVASFVCAATWGEEFSFLGSGTGGTGCYDPGFSVDDWESKDWGIYVVLMDRAPYDCVNGISDISVDVVYDASSGVPASGAGFDLLDAARVQVRGTVEYVVTGGSIVFLDVTANRYSFEIRNLVLTRNSDNDEPVETHCYVPETVNVDLMTFSCVPKIRRDDSC